SFLSVCISISSSIQRQTNSTLFPYTTLFRSIMKTKYKQLKQNQTLERDVIGAQSFEARWSHSHIPPPAGLPCVPHWGIHKQPTQDRKSTRLNSSHVKISYAVFCLKKKISK